MKIKTRQTKGSWLTKADYQIMEKILLRSLSNTQKKTLEKLNPYRIERNALIRRLAQRGVPLVLLARVSGISWPQIFRIVRRVKGGDG